MRCAVSVASEQLTRVRDAAFDRTGGGRQRTDQQRSRSFSLTTFKIAIAGADRIMPGGDCVAIHAQTHRAAGLAPVSACRLESLCQSRRLGLIFDLLRSGHNEQVHAGCDLAASEYLRCCPKI